MSRALKISILNHEIILHPDKVLFFQQYSMMVVSDLHLGKVEHFRKKGIAIPTGNTEKTLLRLKNVIEELKPQKILLLGDLFHSDFNNSWKLFEDFCIEYKHLEFVLVRGNHDILSVDYYKKSGMEYVDTYSRNEFIFSHEPIKDSLKYNIFGHIHPAVKLKSTARQRLILPCYLFSENHANMPAFGEFTGKHIVKPKQGDEVFVVFEDTILRV